MKPGRRGNLLYCKQKLHGYYHDQNVGTGSSDLSGDERGFGRI
ncbi:MAG: hypothetical protein P8105_07230 [Dehalococcoidia bacterium]